MGGPVRWVRSLGLRSEVQWPRRCMAVKGEME